jgi:hypothetical protein
MPLVHFKFSPQLTAGNGFASSGEILMRIAKLTLIGSVVALAITAAPAQAKNAAPPQKTEESVSASCHSYQMAADGSWSVLPCHEAGQTEHRPPPKAGEQEPR